MTIRRAGLALLAAGLVLVGIGAAEFVPGYLEGQRVTQDWLRSQPSPGFPSVEVPSETSADAPAAPDQQPAPAPAATAAPAPRPAALGGIFALAVPKLGYLAAVRQGVTAAALSGGPGHVPDTPMPGQPGNIGVSAHNVYWLRFGEIRTGDELVLKANGRDFAYRVSSVRVVDPDDTQALAYVPGYHLTLTTCWPLWAGALAKQRLVIRGDLAGAPGSGGSA